MFTAVFETTATTFTCLNQYVLTTKQKDTNSTLNFQHSYNKYR